VVGLLSLAAVLLCLVLALIAVLLIEWPTVSAVKVKGHGSLPE
jgi:hypothetical protein